MNVGGNDIELFKPNGQTTIHPRALRDSGAYQLLPL